jgi:MFS family permease
MKRKHLYILYIGLWICLFALTLSVPVKQFANELAGRGSLVQALLFIYGVPVSLLYLLTAFLFDVRAEVIRKEHIISFLGRRRMLIMMFLFVIIALILLILASFTP